MEDSKAKLEEAKLTSAAAFVEGGIQDACDDTCSICLEEFNDCDPSTVTGCKHEFHLQCILEWCQRSSQCPMCWQPISLKDTTSQELLDAVVQERNIRLNPPRNAPIFHHPALGEFEIQHLPVGVNDAELEERIIQHLAAAAAMGRARHFARREGHRGRSSAQGRPQFLVFSAHPGTQSSTVSNLEGGQADSTPVDSVAVPSSPLRIGVESSPYVTTPNHLSQRDDGSSSEIRAFTTPEHTSPSSSGRSPNQYSPRSQDRAGLSDLQSVSEALKSRLNAMSMRYKESISKSTRSWKERWFSCNTPISDVSPEVRREESAGMGAVSGMMERLEIRDNGRASTDSLPCSSDRSSAHDSGMQYGAFSATSSEEIYSSNDRSQVPCATGPASDCT